jgi:creatinine amidohydrolase
MRIGEMNWMQVEEYLKSDNRCALPLGSTEQHAYLSLSVDSILSERIALEAAEPLNIPVFPVVSYGLTPYFLAYPGSISLRVETYVRVLREILDCLAGYGFKRIVVVNGHGGNSPAQGLAREWMSDHPGVKVKWHNWWNAPRTWEKVMEIDPVASHASWMENFPWTRLPGVQVPKNQKPMIDPPFMNLLDAKALREYLKDGNFGGLYQRPDEDMLAIWRVAVEEARTLFTEGWE